MTDKIDKTIEDLLAEAKELKYGFIGEKKFKDNCRRILKKDIPTITIQESSDEIKDTLIQCYKLGNKVLHDEDTNITDWIDAMKPTEELLKKMGYEDL